MDFAPEPSSGGGYYERYVSESESTDGEGDASGGGVAATVQRNNGNRQQIRTQRRLDKTATDDYHDFATIQGCGVHFAGDPSVSFKRSGSSSSSSSTIFSKLAASWSIGVSSSKNSDDRHSKNRGEIGGDKSNGWKQGQGGKSTHYSGGLDEGDNGRRAQSLRHGYSKSTKEISVISSSSGLKGSKSSLLADNDGPMPRPPAGGGDGAAGGGGDGDGNVPSGLRGRGAQGLWRVASRGEVDSMSVALAPGGGGDVNACQVDGWTALHSAADAGHSPLVALLLKTGAFPHARARKGLTPLHVACMRGRSQAAKALLAAGADSNARSDDQRTPLHFACEAGSEDCVKKLLLAGAAANVSDQDARTPLHFACIDGSTDCVRRLLRAGASTLPPDAWGRDPAAVARQLGRAGPLKLLEAAAAAAGGGSSGGSGRKSLPPTFMRSPSAGVDAGGDGLRAGDGGGRVRITGNRWVVMNEGGRMLERGSGKVALFRSMAAAADWANGLEIKSGSFQVAEVAPGMRKAFEKEVDFEVTGAGTVSEEEEEEEQDPQWTRYRRQRAAAAHGGSASAGRKKRAAWAATVQRRDQEEERALLAAAADKLRRVALERDAHRERAASLERTLAAVLGEYEIAAAAAVGDAAASVADPVAEGRTSKPTAISAAGAAVSTADSEEAEKEAGNGAEKEGVATNKEGLLAVREPELVVVVGDDGDIGNPDGDAAGVVQESGGNLIESKAGGEVVEVEETLKDSRAHDGNGIIARGGDRPVMSLNQDYEDSDEPAGQKEEQPNDDDIALLPFKGATDAVKQDKDAHASSPFEGATDGVRDGYERTAERVGAERITSCGIDRIKVEGIKVDRELQPVEAVVGTPAAAGERECEGGKGPGEEEEGSGDDEAAQARLSTWLSGLKIRRSDAARYAGSLVTDGFDSEEALRGVREEELMQYGMKKGHARLIVQTLARGCSL